jgi:ABC-type glycerol-3-phosphate transport system substrate-binding protein
MFGFFWFVFALTLCSGCQAVKTQEPIQLKMLVMDNAHLSSETISQILEEFHADHPGIRIQAEYAPAQSLHDLAVTALSSNPASVDIVAVDNTWYPEFVKSGFT